ncbi:MAG: hypothetical protein KY439_09945 [Actinobacteria bacterium]|jgi:hypothetical protein|nr:hypothetical protein [Actinomycetota bacterium]
MATETVLAIPAYIDVTDPTTKTEWVAKVAGMPGEAFVGLFAFGPTFADARKALAHTVYESLKSGSEGVAAQEISAVRILATTRKTFSTETLAAGQ